MAANQTLTTAQQIAVGAGDVAYTVIAIIFILLVIGVIFFIIISNAQYKYKVRIRYIINDRRRIVDDMAKVVKKEGQVYWKTKKTRLILTVPPSEVMDIDEKGRMVAEVYVTNKDEHFWTKGKTPYVILEEDKYKWVNDDAQVQDFEPVTTEERDLFINRMERAKLRRGNSLKDNIVPLAGLAALIIIAVCLMIFWGDMAKPLIDQANTFKETQLSAQKTAELNKETADILLMIKQDVQLLKGAQSLNSSTNIKAPK